ncbi:uncharacterized protein I206_107463 [Kwoniella pini CBS 10737]|uniref:Nicotinamide-nucleotide adenylyltransferase n=1 Tax=Kwoniella pini CBS 10737 TaxID=1296096 RepID=A0A1B9HXE8_9TREE|nr:uncharacterized protein I206_05792 [Kwoniella pini CBS 10737]OCF47928.1 hypothetical protein I206_05792 [Kwoniella pini CBS 10737]
MTAKSHIQDTINRISSTPGSFELISSPTNWPISHNTAQKGSISNIHIAILDSSFNPPTIAHQAIAFSSFPSTSNTNTIQDDIDITSSSYSSSNEPIPYTCRLLLFSARNVEKQLRSKDTTVLQRLEMMSILSNSKFKDNNNNNDNIAIGLINEPTFVGKSSIIRNYLKNSLKEISNLNLNLSFLVGTDTLIRFFDPKFYPKNQMEIKLNEYFESGSYLISAKRGSDETNRAIEEEVLNRDGIKQWVNKGNLRLLGTGNEGWEEISSTKVREAVLKQNWDEVDKLVGKEMRDYIRKEGLYTS